MGEKKVKQEGVLPSTFRVTSFCWEVHSVCVCAGEGLGEGTSGKVHPAVKATTKRERRPGEAAAGGKKHPHVCPWKREDLT